MGEGNECAVCYDAFKFPKLLPCKHTFCASCLYEFLAGLEDKSNLVCPLCREPCFVPDKGFSDFPTNYFVPVEKIAKLCQECEAGIISKVCYICSATLCFKCGIAHTHKEKIKESDDSDRDSDSESVSDLPFHVRWSLMHRDMRTEFLCKQFSVFVPEFSTTDNQRKRIRTMSASRNGGVYINRPESEHLLSYNDQGVVIGRIPLLDEAAAILETSNGLLLVAHYGLKIIICYNDGSQNFRYFQFAKTPSFHPIGLSELRNGDIVICGPEKLGNKETDIKGNYNGVIRTYTQQGRLLREFAFEKPEQILTFPTEITCNSKRDTIAVCDTTQKKVHVFDYEGKLLASYNGFSWIPELETFHPVSVCSTHNGYYLIADIRSEYLHVLDLQGKFIGILRCENGECLSETNTVCVDSKNNIWIGHYGQGTVTVLKQTRFKNNLQPSSLPFLPARPQDADLSFLSGLQLADHI